MVRWPWDDGKMAGTGTARQPHWIATAADTRVWWDLPGLLKLPQKTSSVKLLPPDWQGLLPQWQAWRQRQAVVGRGRRQNEAAGSVRDYWG